MQLPNARGFWISNLLTKKKTTRKRTKIIFPPLNIPAWNELLFMVFQLIHNAFGIETQHASLAISDAVMASASMANIGATNSFTVMIDLMRTTVLREVYRFNYSSCSCRETNLCRIAMLLSD